MHRHEAATGPDSSPARGAAGEGASRPLPPLDPSQGAPRAPAGTTGPRTGLLPLQRPGAATRPLRALKAGKP